jgi:hypothetical protein
MTIEEAIRDQDLLWSQIIAAPRELRTLALWAAIEIDRQRAKRANPTLAAMREAVPDQLMRDLVADGLRGVSEPRSLASTSGPSLSVPVPHGTGWQKDVGFPDRSRDFELMDNLVAGMIGGPNDTSKLRR